MKKKKDTEFGIENCTHKLECSHVIGKNRYTYYMDCIPLKTMSDGRVKVLVFGDRYWKGHEDKKRIRYVKANRLKINNYESETS